MYQEAECSSVEHSSPGDVLAMAVPIPPGSLLVPKQRSGLDAVLYKRGLLITKVKATVEKAKRRGKQAKDLMAILQSMTKTPKKARSKLLRKVRCPPSTPHHANTPH